MKIKTKRFDKTVPLPEYAELASGFNFVCRENIAIKPGESKAIPSNIAMEIPDGYVLLVVPRSSTSSRFGLSMPHSLGIIDPFYRGDDNEIMLIFHNFGKKESIIRKGDKIAQGILVKYEKVLFNEVDKLGESIVKKWRKNKRCD
ncbi:MAG: dUTP diphosphatase [Parcubacteria group bacterium]|nr:dUTP diphosphatase [Parcubacteria group bacterium]